MTDMLDILKRLRHPRILVLGDVMLDRYTWGDAERVSPEAPVLVLRADQEEIRPGGAASVAYLLKHLDAEVVLAGVVGDDPDGYTLRAVMRDEGIDDHLLWVDPLRQTTVKHRFVGRASDRHPHQILRVDHETRAPISSALESRLCGAIQEHLSQFDAVLVSDYLKGTCTEFLLRTVIESARFQGIPVLVDPGRVPDYERYRGATLLKPNRGEAECALGKGITSSADLLAELRTLCHTLEFDCVMITLDRDGLIVVTSTDHSVIPTLPRAVYDITGAGDMVLAALGLCLASKTSIFEAATFANAAAGLEVERFGIAAVARQDIEASIVAGSRSNCQSPVTTKLISLDQAVALANQYRQQGKRIVFTNGCFDLLHVGHVTYLQEAAAMGDVLFVAANSDAGVRRLKGATRPIIAEQDRATMLASLGCVNHVLIFEEDTPHQLLRMIRPHVLIKGGTTNDIIGREVVEKYGGQVYHASTQPGISTSRIMQEMQSRDANT